ncbi:phosphate ABC transporter ATP-binding protein, partial [Chloroflexales bacterium ZM16-3]|nr:phosphate ABC transporter ATP-binding protein [Chloroflexales bacterium ZM16-3]
MDTTSATTLTVKDTSLYYGGFRAVKDINLHFRPRAVTAIIGSSGCGKSTMLRSLNRINDRVNGFRVEGTISLGDEDIYAPTTDVVDLRRRVGMVFQRPNPFPMSIFDNVAFGLTLYAPPKRADLEMMVETALRASALWGEVKDKLRRPATELSGGQQQRLCIARAIATRPDVLLMDEPCSALDPISTLKVEELIAELKRSYTVVIVTHNMQQAARASDVTVMMNMDEADRAGNVIEVGETDDIFTNPKHPQTEAYVSGR